jgi:hypothetical protein
VTRQHGLQIPVRRPDAMHAMFQSELPSIDLDLLTPSQPPTYKMRIGFENERLQPALSEMQRYAQSSNPTSDNNYILR